jgi:hypothetical protein
MKTNLRILGAFAGLLAAIAFASPATRAQSAPDPDAPVSPLNPSAPIIVKDKPLKAKWLKAEVIHADQISLMVREEKNGLQIHTFTYSDKAREKMQEVLDAGGYQYGDKIEVRYMPGKTEALDIRGAPSKPI